MTVNQDTAARRRTRRRSRSTRTTRTASSAARTTTSPAPGHARSPVRRAARSATATPARTSRTTAARRGAARRPTRSTSARSSPASTTDRRSVRRRRRPRGRVRQPRPRVLRRTRLQPHERAEHGGCQPGHLLAAATSAGAHRRSSTRRPRRPLSMTRSGSRSTATRAARSGPDLRHLDAVPLQRRTTARYIQSPIASPRRATAARRSRRRSRSQATCSTAKDRARSSGPTGRCTCSGTARPGSRR